MIKALPDLIEDFLRFLRVQRGRTVLTVRNYRLYLDRFLHWSDYSHLKQAADITKEKLRDYRLWLTRQQSLGGIPLSSATQNYHLTALRSFVNYLQHKGVATLSASNITLNAQQKKYLTILNSADIKKLSETIKESREPILVKLRDQAMVSLILVSGLKVSEVVTLTINQVNNGELVFVRRGKKFTLPLPNELNQLIKNYLSERHDKSTALFIRHDRAAKARVADYLTPRSIQRSLERYRKLAGLKQKITPHTLRHSYATDLAAQGVDLPTLQEKLGLKNSSTASVYQQPDKPTH